MMTEPAQIPEFGRSVVLEGDLVMVDLESLGHLAAGHHTLQVPVLQGAADMGRHGPSQMADTGHVHPVTDDHLENGFAQDVGGRGQGNGADTGNFTRLAVFEFSPSESGQFDQSVKRLDLSIFAPANLSANVS